MWQLQPDPYVDGAGCTRRFLRGLALLAVLVLNCAAGATPEELSQVLKRADGVKTSNHAEFTSLLQSIDTRSDALSLPQRQYLQYLKGWKHVYDGEYETAIPMLSAIAGESRDSTLRFRAGATLVNVLAFARQHEEAFLRLNELLALLPLIADNDAREQGLGVAALLYNQVGEYDLSLSYAQKMVEENWADRGACKGGQVRLEALYKSGRLRAAGSETHSVISECIELGELLRANAIRIYVAKLHVDQGRPEEAIDLLNEHYEQVQGIHSPHLSSEYDALLAQAYREKGEAAPARQFALRAIEGGVRNQYTEPLVAAYRLLYVLAKEQGDSKAALAYYEKYAAADKGYLDDVSARQLAYERVNHETAANKLQIDALNKQNEVLKLERENSSLYITLLLMLLAFIALWAYRTKRSQMHFMKLSQVDGLTGIANRPHFIDLAGSALETGRKTHHELCIVLCDLDHFKAINDKYGHATGDFVLKQAVAACQAHLRASDIFGRFGGEEFGIVLPGCGLEDARQRAERLRTAIAAIAIDRNDAQSHVSASFGIAATGSSGYELRQLLAHADAALYRAKNAGRDRVVLHDAKGGIGAVTGSFRQHA